MPRAVFYLYGEHRLSLAEWGGVKRDDFAARAQALRGERGEPSGVPRRLRGRERMGFGLVTGLYRADLSSELVLGALSSPGTALAGRAMSPRAAQAAPVRDRLDG